MAEQRDRDSASMGGSNSVATGLSFDRDLWPQVIHCQDELYLGQKRLPWGPWGR